MHTNDGGTTIGGVLGLLIHLGLCYAVGKYAESKGRSFWLGALLSFFLSPLIGFIIVVIMGSGNRVAR